MNTLIDQEKIWGSVSHIFNDKVAVSILHVKKGFRCSTHYHAHRWNKFHSIDAILSIMLKKSNEKGALERKFVLSPGESCSIPPGTIHSFEVIGSGCVVETYWTMDGTPVDLDDIHRYDEGGPV